MPFPGRYIQQYFLTVHTKRSSLLLLRLEQNIITQPVPLQWTCVQAKQHTVALNTETALTVLCLEASCNHAFVFMHRCMPSANTFRSARCLCIHCIIIHGRWYCHTYTSTTMKPMPSKIQTLCKSYKPCANHMGLASR